MSFIYFTKDDCLPGVRQFANLGFDYIDFIDLLWDEIVDYFSNIRLIVLEYPFLPGKKHIRFLHWDDAINLDELDAKVSAGNYTDDDFKKSIITLLGRTFCIHRTCSWEAYTLVMDYQDAYIFHSELRSRKLREHKFYNCPNCGKPLTLAVAKIFNRLPEFQPK